MRTLLVLLACLPALGCGVVAAPCRVTSAVIDMVPVVGHVAATPTDACAEVDRPEIIATAGKRVGPAAVIG